MRLTSLLFVLLAAAPLLGAEINWTGAKWVWDAAETNESNEPRYFRRAFELADKPTEAKLSISADNEYVVYVNGHKVGEDGEWQQAETYDVAKWLVKGRNCVAIRARNQGGPAGLIATLRVKLAGKETVAAATDGTWKLTSKETPGWLTPEFDEAASKAQWVAAGVLGDASIGPWNIAGGTGPSTGTPTNITSYRPASEELERFQLPEGFQIELVAAEPLIINPVAIALDEQGRIYVSESHSYRFGPSGSPIKPSTNPVVRLDRGADGKMQRTLVAEGFDDPVMGMLVKDGKIWCAANNFLFRFDLDEQGRGANKTMLLEDKNKAWNPFGMFVLEWGPDGLLYMSVGDHNIDIRGPNNTVSGRGRSGIVCRMKPDGSDLERLVHGLRVPYSFEVDPFGQMWLLSNGEGNPNRFLRVIEGVDYHCFTRGGADYEWLSGRHPLAPPCFELPRGAHTQLMRYYSAGFPESFQGSLLLDNWGAHGFNGGNRSIFRYTTDERNRIATKEAWLSCSDPHFRCSHVLMSPDGGLLIADWYGRDDESDLTGRIWKVTYTGSEKKPAVTHSLDSPEWKSDDYALAALSSPQHLVRQKAVDTLVARGNEAVAKLASEAAAAREPIGAAQALWALSRIGTREAHAALRSGGKHADWRVRRLALNILYRFDPAGGSALGDELAGDPDPAVRVAAGVAQADAGKAIATLLAALENGAAEDEHLRYEAAWHLARRATDAKPFTQLLASKEENIRLSGFIALDIAMYEGFESSKSAARETLAGLLSDAGRTEFDLPLALAAMNQDATLAPALQSLVVRTDVPPAVTARAILLLTSIASSSKTPLKAIVASRFLEAIDTGAVKLTSTSDQLTHIDLLDAEGPSERAVRYFAKYAASGQSPVRAAAISRLRKHGPKSNAAAEPLWSRLFSLPRQNLDERLDLVGTLAEIEGERNRANWERLLTDKDPAIRVEAVRTWRLFKGRPEFVELLKASSAPLTEQDAALQDDLAFVARHLDPAASPVAPADKEAKEKLYTEMLTTLAEATKLPAAEKQVMAHLGRRVFERTGCTKCHTTATQDTPLAPSLRNVGQGLKHEGLVEAVLFPSKVIKTGFLPESIVTVDGRVFSGLVRDEGQKLRVLTADKETVVDKADIERREVQKVSIMPEGQEQLISRNEFRDLLLYLLSLK